MAGTGIDLQQKPLKKADQPVPDKPTTSFEWTNLFWAAQVAAESAVAMTRMMGAFSAPAAEPETPAAEPVWTSEHEIVLELGAARLSRFTAGSTPGRRPILVCAPFALHDARLVDICEGHSLMAVLRGGGAPLYLVEWLSAKSAQAFLGIDDYLSDLNVLVDEIGGVCDFIGLCQGGWLSLIFAARFPAKAGKLVLAGAPIDINAADSKLSALARSMPLETFQEVVRLGEGLARGDQALSFWRNDMESPKAIHALLQSELPLDSPRFAAQAALVRAWSGRKLNLPGAYYLEVAEKFYKHNQLAKGEFVALGQRIALHDMRRPLYLLAALDDEVAAPEQTLTCAGLVGTPRAALRARTTPGSHISLFIGAKSLEEVWPDVLDWLAAGDKSKLHDFRVKKPA
jgi:poly(3-hydroxyalkanoate) synthetase